MTTMMSMKTSDLLNCRLVCKNWKDAVDRVVGNDENPRVRKVIVHPNPFSDTFNLCQDSNPFPGRSLMIVWTLKRYEDKNAEDKQFELDIVRFLKKFGKQVWNLRLRVIWDGVYGSSSNLQSALRQMPNLRVLHLEPGKGYDKRPGSLLGWLSGFPKLEHLHTVIFEKCMHEPAVTAVLQANPHIRKLKILETFGFGFPYVWNPLQLPCLTELEINGILDIGHFQLVQWKIKKLKLRACFAGHRGFLRDVKKFVVFQPTLECLDIIVPPGRDHEVFTMFVAKMVNLRKLFIGFSYHSVIGWETGLGFLKPLKKLESLSLQITEWKWERMKWNYEMGPVHFLHCMDNMEESNIWDVFPKLQSVSVMLTDRYFPGTKDQFQRRVFYRP